MTSILSIILVIILVGIHVAFAAILVGNLVYLRTLSATREPERWPSLSVFIPARNEEANLRRLLPTLFSQDYDQFDVVVYDDGSTDGTWDLLQQFEDDRLRTIRGEGPPPGWVGKVNALYQATRGAGAEVYLFLDADGEFANPDALKRMVASLLSQPRDSVMTGLPRLRGGGRMLVSLVPFAMLSVLPWFLIRRGPHQFGALNGQLWMIRGADYRKLEPHRAHAGEILEDVRIGRFLSANAIKPYPFDATRCFNVYMYRNVRDAWSGFKKNAYLLMGGTPASFLFNAAFFLVVYLVSPFISPWFLASTMALKAITDVRTRFGPTVTLSTPAALVVSVLIQWDSAIAHWRGRVSWKGRTIK